MTSTTSQDTSTNPFKDMSDEDLRQKLETSRAQSDAFEEKQFLKKTHHSNKQSSFCCVPSGGLSRPSISFATMFGKN